MRWRASLRDVLPHLLWACLVLAVAAYGAEIVRNVTDALLKIAGQSDTVATLDQPHR